jgi:hypothetical protein
VPARPQMPVTGEAGALGCRCPCQEMSGPQRADAFVYHARRHAGQRKLRVAHDTIAMAALTTSKSSTLVGAAGGEFGNARPLPCVSLRRPKERLCRVDIACLTACLWPFSCRSAAISLNFIRALAAACSKRPKTARSNQNAPPCSIVLWLCTHLMYLLHVREGMHAFGC